MHLGGHDSAQDELLTAPPPEGPAGLQGAPSAQAMAVS